MLQPLSGLDQYLYIGPLWWLHLPVYRSMCPAHLLILPGPRERSHSPFTYYSTTPPSNTAQGPFINQTANIRTSNATLNTKVKVTTHIYTPLSSEKCRCLLFVHFDVYFLLPWVNTRDRRKMGDWALTIPWSSLITATDCPHGQDVQLCLDQSSPLLHCVTCNNDRLQWDSLNILVAGQSKYFRS